MSQINVILENVKLPKVIKVSQKFENIKLNDVEENLYEKLIKKNLGKKIKEGSSIAITGGSRGISCYTKLMKTIVDFVKEKGGIPFIVPAMGSHGGGNAIGQIKMLEKLGISEKNMGCKIISSMEVVEIGKTSKNLPVYIDKKAYSADGIILLNRVKAHTSFRGEYESGLIKMIAIGLGKRKGAESTHSLRFENMAENILESGKLSLEHLNIIGGICTIENAYDEVADIFVLNKDEILDKEPQLLEKSKELMPKIY